MPHPGRMTTQKAKDFKGTMRSLLAELGHYKFRLIAVIVFAVLSTIFNIAGPKVLAVPAQTVAIDDEPFDSRISDTTRTA